MKVSELLEQSISHYRLSDSDKALLAKEIDMNKHWLMSAACSEWIRPIQNDKAFAEIEWNFIQYWQQNKGFSENDLRYLKACGYNEEQFQKGEAV